MTPGGRNTATVAYLTIGQTPRVDLVPDLRELIGVPHRAVELGVLDDIDVAGLDAAEPRAEEPRLVTRTTDGSEVALRASWVHDRMCSLIRRAAARNPDLIVLLCTGHFRAPRVGMPLVMAQSVVDHGTLALTRTGTLGILVPHRAQAEAIEGTPHWPTWLPDASRRCRVVASHASPYTGTRFPEAAKELAGAGLIVMHCMGYDEAMRRQVRKASKRPVLLARRMVADAVRQLL
jgi:protein AroM